MGVSAVRMVRRILQVRSAENTGVGWDFINLGGDSFDKCCDSSGRAWGDELFSGKCNLNLYVRDNFPYSYTRNIPLLLPMAEVFETDPILKMA